MVTFVGATTDATAGGTVFTNTTAPVAPMPAGIAANDVAIVSIDFFGTGTTVTLTGYGSQLDNTGTASDHRIVYTKLLTGSETNVAPTMSVATWGTLEVAVWRGLASATPVNKVSQATSFASGGGTFTNPSLTIASPADATVYGYPATATGNSSSGHPNFTATPASLSNWTNDTTSGTTAGATQGIGWGINVSSPGTATVNIPGPTTGSGLAWALDFTASAAAQPVLTQPGGQVYRRRFRRVQQPYPLSPLQPPPQVAGFTSQPGLAVPGLFTPGSPGTPGAPQAAPPVYPLGHPVQARRLLARGGTVTRRAGTYQGSGPPLRPQDGPVRAQPASPLLTGRADGRAGIFAGLGPAVRALAQAVAGKLRGLPPRGRTASVRGMYAGTGPPVYPAHGPVQARRLPQRGGGRATRATGTYAGTGPQLRPPEGPVRAWPAGRRGGSAQSRAGTFTFVSLTSAPPVYPLGHPVQARRLPQRGGSTVHRAGTYAGTGPVLKPPEGPVQARQPLPPHGRAASRAGTFTAAVTSGPPVYPARHPVQACRPPLQGGRVIRRAGTYQGSGTPAPPLHQPIGVQRRQPAPPARGRTASQRGLYSGTGPPAVPLRRPVRGQPAVPLLTGRADGRAGTYAAPFVPLGILAATTSSGVNEPATYAPTGSVRTVSGVNASSTSP